MTDVSSLKRETKRYLEKKIMVGRRKVSGLRRVEVIGSGVYLQRTNVGRPAAKRFVEIKMIIVAQVVEGLSEKSECIWKCSVGNQRLSENLKLRGL